MATRHLSSEHRARRRSLALESARHLERSRRPGLLHRFGHADGGDSLFLRLPSAAPRIHPERWHRQRRILPPYRWRPKYLLEKQSLSYAALHRGERFAASPVGGPRFGPDPDGGHHADQLGRTLRDQISDSVLGG